MSRNNKRVNSVKYGICTNMERKPDGTMCSLCQKKEKQAIRSTKDFVCAECGAPLTEVTPPKPFPTKLVVTILSIVLLAAAVVIGIMKHKGNESVPDPDTPGIDTPKRGTPPSNESVSLSLNKEIISLYVGESDTLKATVFSQPEDANITVFYTSDNENVAHVGNNGVVKAIGQGEASITVIVRMESGVADTALVKVIANEVLLGPDPSDNTPPVTNPGSRNANSNYGTYDLGWGTYNGPKKNGKPHGEHGIIVVTQTHSININDLSGRTISVYPGDSIETKFVNGRLHSGEVYCKGKDGKTILIPPLF